MKLFLAILLLATTLGGCTSLDRPASSPDDQTSKSRKPNDTSDVFPRATGGGDGY